MTNGQTLRDLLTAMARRHGKKTFLEYGHENYSFGEVDDRTDRVATALNLMGLHIGDRVALLLRNRPEFVFFFFGAPKVGIIPVLVDSESTEEEIRSVLLHCGAAAVVTESAFAGLRERIPEVSRWVVVDDESFAEPPFRSLSGGPVLRFWPDLDATQDAVLVYPRKSRPVVLSHRNLMSNSACMLLPFRINQNDRFLCAMPLNSVIALVVLLLVPWSAGAACILREAFSPRILRDAEETGATVLAGGPRLYRKMMESEDFATSDLSPLRLAICVPSFGDRQALAQFEEKHDALFVEGYGLAETAGMCCSNPYTGVRKPGSLGLPLPGQECRIVDRNGQEVSQGGVGEITVRGSNVMKRYYRDPEASGRVLRNGWLHTGDTGFVDSDGYYFMAEARAEEAG